MDVIKATVREIQNLCLRQYPTSTVQAVCVRCCFCWQWLLSGGWDANIPIPNIRLHFPFSITDRTNSFDSFGPVENSYVGEQPYVVRLTYRHNIPESIHDSGGTMHARSCNVSHLIVT